MTRVPLVMQLTNVPSVAERSCEYIFSSSQNLYTDAVRENVRDCTADSASYHGPAGTLFFFCIYAPATDSSKYPKAEEWAVFMHKGDSIMTDFDDVRTENYPLLQSA